MDAAETGLIALALILLVAIWASVLGQWLKPPERR
jgi:hypothetical protein